MLLWPLPWWVVAAVTETNPALITFLHTPQAFLPSGLDTLDGRFFALAGNTIEAFNVVKFPDIPVGGVWLDAPVQVDPANTLNEVQANAKNGFSNRGRAAAGTAGVHELPSYRGLPRLVPLLIRHRV
jgi:hypothetical protein